jgi:hypothetical protein
MKMETLRRLRPIAKPDDYGVSFDLKDGFYALAIAPQDREALAMNIDGQLLQLCALPMGWSPSPFTFQKLTRVFTHYLRESEETATSPGELLLLPTKAKRKWLRRRRHLTGARVLPFVDDFAMFAVGFAETMLLTNKTFALLRSVGLHIHETKGHHVVIRMGYYRGMTLDFKCGMFRALINCKKLKWIAKLATQFLRKGVANKRWVSMKALASLDG